MGKSRTLEDILCIIHRDGGHDITKNGISKSYDKAVKILYKYMRHYEKTHVNFTLCNQCKIKLVKMDKPVTTYTYIYHKACPKCGAQFGKSLSNHKIEQTPSHVSKH